jgi:hypothetical protein
VTHQDRPLSARLQAALPHCVTSASGAVGAIRESLYGIAGNSRIVQIHESAMIAVC